MDNALICRFCFNRVNGQYVSIDSVMIERLQILCSDMKTTLLEDSVICPSCSDLLKKFDCLRNKYNRTKETCKVCGENVVDQYHGTSSDTLQLCDDLGFSVPINSKVCDECMNTMYELNTLKVTLNSTQNRSFVHCDKSTIKEEMEMGSVELLQSHSNLPDEPNACLEINTTKTETESSCVKINYCHKNDELLGRIFEHQVLGSPSLSISSSKDERKLLGSSNRCIGDDIEHSGPSNCSFEDDVKEHSKEHDDEMQREMKTSENLKELLDRPSEHQVLGSPSLSISSFKDERELSDCSNSSSEDDIEHSGPSNCSFEVDVEKYSEQQDDQMQGIMRTPENFEDPNEWKTLDSQKSASQVDDEEFNSCDKSSFESRNKGAVEAYSWVNNKSGKVSMFECHICEYKTKIKSHLKIHLLIHKKPEDVKMFECHICKYRTKGMKNLRNHILIHEDVKMFECHICKYKTKDRRNFNKHLLIHKKPEDVEMFECHICKYRAKERGNLNKHLLIHKKPEDVDMFECHICGNKLKRMNDLKKHLLIHKKPEELEMFHICENKSNHNGNLLIHKKPEEVEMFECNICEYKTKLKANLTSHLLIHTKSEDTQMFKCNIYEYKEKIKSKLDRNVLIHQKPEDVEMFECHICKYKTNHNRNLHKHLLLHKKPEEVEMFDCHICEHKTKYKGSHKRHLLIHKKPEDVEMFECHICEYKAIQKNSVKRHILLHKKTEDVEMFECNIPKK